MPTKAEMQKINLEIDLKLAKYWALMGEDQEFTRDEMARYMRAAYAQGYKDRHAEAEKQEGGKWARELGFSLKEA